MKKTFIIFSLLIILVGCTRSSEYDISMADIDIGLNMEVEEAFAEIGIRDKLMFKEVNYDETDDLNFVLEEYGDRKNHIYETEYDGEKMVIFIHQDEGEWSLSKICDTKLKKDYWIYKDMAKYFDIYDWRTGELITEE